jgi:uncharacterized membrane protein (UPF0136 family)
LSDAEEWHEPASVTVTRLVCQAAVTLIVLGFSVFLILTHPEYNAGVALVCGVVLGSWFAVPAELRRAGRRRRKDAEE